MTGKRLSNGGSWKTGLLIIGFSLGILLLSFIDLCAYTNQCIGWNAINPFCLAGLASCIASWGLISLIMKIGGVILFLVGVWKLIKDR